MQKGTKTEQTPNSKSVKMKRRAEQVKAQLDTFVVQLMIN
jgi:hypothetical protein